MGLKQLLIDTENGLTLPNGGVFNQRNLSYGDSPPLVTQPIPKVEQSTPNTQNFVNNITEGGVRGGIINLTKSLTQDTERLGKLMAGETGLKFLSSNVALQKTNPENVTSPRNRQFSGIQVLGSALSSPLGIRFRRDGLIDSDTEDGYNYDAQNGVYSYEKLARLNLDSISYNDANLNNNVLLQLYSSKIIGIGSKLKRVSNDENVLLKYNGGAHSVAGIGETTIKRYKSNPYGVNPYLPKFNTEFGTISVSEGSDNYGLIGLNGNDDFRRIKQKDFRGASLPWFRKSKSLNNVYRTGLPGILLNNRKPNENGINYGDYTVHTIDKLNAANIFKREGLVGPTLFKDLIKFRIAVVDTDRPLNDKVILFRAFLDNIGDNYTGEWNSHKYNGRAEKFYIYSGFDRRINFSFKIHTQTRWEMKPLWRKLNYLVAQTAPEYKNRRMRGVYSRLTIGDWMNELPGFFTSVNLSWRPSYVWETRQDGDVNGVDENLNEYPHVLDVSCTFVPIHSFSPTNEPCAPFILPEIGVSEGRKWAHRDERDNETSTEEGRIRDCYTADGEAFAFIDETIDSVPQDSVFTTQEDLNAVRDFEPQFEDIPDIPRNLGLGSEIYEIENFANPDPLDQLNLIQNQGIGTGISSAGGLETL